MLIPHVPSIDKSIFRKGIGTFSDIPCKLRLNSPQGQHVIVQRCKNRLVVKPCGLVQLSSGFYSVGFHGYSHPIGHQVGVLKPDSKISTVTAIRIDKTVIKEEIVFRLKASIFKKSAEFSACLKSIYF